MTLSLDDLKAVQADVFAPWVQALGLTIEDATGARFKLPVTDDLMRRGGEGGGVLCGQAMGAAADTASVIALTAANGRLRPVTTVDQTVHFLRPLPEGVVEIAVEAVSNGRRMAVTRVEFRAAATGKLGAVATCAFAYLGD